MTIKAKTPWPKAGIGQYSQPGDGQWGYLVEYDDGQMAFVDSETPTEAEIMDRWGIYFTTSGEANET